MRPPTTLHLPLVTHCVRVAGYSPATMGLRQQSRVAMSRVWMCDAEDAPAEEPAEESATSVLDDLSSENAALLDQIKGLTLEEAAALMKDMESAFNVGPKGDDDDSDAE